MKRILTIIMSLTLAAAAAAQTDGHQYKYFRKGFYLGFDASSGFSVNERFSTSARNSVYGLDMAMGYRFAPTFAVGFGFGGHAFSNRTATCSGTVEREVETTSVPVFLRLRSDFLDRPVSPFLQLDLGYSFVFLYSTEAHGTVSHNDRIFMDRVYELGFRTLEQYESHFRHLHPETSTDEADRLWAAELQRLRSFTNGRSDYIPLENTHIQYGKHGLFASLDLGVSWKVGDSGRMSAAICTGLSQSYYGTCLRTQENEILHFGRVDYLPYEKGQQKVLVRTVGHEDFMDSFDVDVRVKIGFVF